LLLVATAVVLAAPSDAKTPPSSFPAGATVTTLALLPAQTEGLTGDSNG
jgi:hypothetical protein